MHCHTMRWLTYWLAMDADSAPPSSRRVTTHFKFAEQVHPHCTGVATYMSGAHLLDRLVMHNPVNLASEHLHPH
jgi:hypothetical protein